MAGMTNMSRNNSATSLQGFSVCQPTLGAALQFLPALGTPELDTLIDAFLPGPSSLKDKRATVCMDFCEYARQTGETIKFYPVYPSVATESPASMYDSGYGSNFDVSPVMSDLTWSQTTSYAPSATSAKRKSSVVSRTTSDFSHIPGMKIMTKDGQDVTNSASRGCKTKEQRDHAHLMRIIKACDACRRKKIRCDPSHKKRTVSSPSEPKPAKKAKKAAEPRIESPMAETSLFGNASFHLDETTAVPALDQFSGFSDQAWDQFVQYDEDPAFMPVEYDFFTDPQNYFSPGSGTSTSPSQPFTPAPTSSSVDAFAGSLFFESDGQEATLPYLNPGGHGSNYVDFNLYSPASSFIDEEPQMIQAKARVAKQGQSPPRLEPQDAGSTSSSGGLDTRPTSKWEEESYFCGCTDGQPTSQAVSLFDPGWSPHQRSPREQRGATASEALSGLGAVSSDTISWLSSPDSSSRTQSTINSRTQSTTRHGGSYVTQTTSPTHGPTRDASCQPTLGTPSPPPSLQQVKRCGKDGPTPATSLSSLSTGSVSSMRSGVSSPLSSLSSSPSSPSWSVSSTGVHLVEVSAVDTSFATRHRHVAGPIAVTSTSQGSLQVASVNAGLRRGDLVDNVQRLATSRSTPTQQQMTTAYQASATYSVAEQANVATVSRLSSQLQGGDGRSTSTSLLDRGATTQVSLGSSTGLLLTAILLLTLPIRQIVGGNQSSNSWFLFSVLVGLGLTSLLSGHIMQSLSSDLLSKFLTVALSLAPAAIWHHSSQPVSASATTSHTVLQDTFDNVKSKIQQASAEVHNLRCALSRRFQQGPRNGSLQQTFSG